MDNGQWTIKLSGRLQSFSIVRCPLINMAVEPENFVEKRPVALFFKHIVRKVFLEDWAMKLIALAITFALWLGVTGLSTPGSESYTVPLNLRTSDNSVVTSSLLQEVEIRVSGDKRKIEQLKEGDLRVSLDLTDVAAGEHVISLTPDTVSITLPLGIRLDAIRPNKIPIRLENVEEREISVTPETTGEIPEGFELYGQTAFPQKVRVRGPSSFIRSLNSVSTEKIDLTDHVTDFSVKQIPISVSNPKATLLETVVDVTLRIGEKRVERLFSMPIPATQLMVTFTLYGPRSLLAKARTDMFVFEYRTQGDDTGHLVLPTEWQGVVEIRDLRVRRRP